LHWKTALGKYNGGPYTPQNPDGSFQYQNVQKYVDDVWNCLNNFLPQL